MVKRKLSDNSEDKEQGQKIQRSIDSFFNAPSSSTQEIPVELPVNEDGDVPIEPETNEEVFFSSSMYTDEVNTMISVILQGEKYLLNEDELLLLAQYSSLSGTVLCITTQILNFQINI